jgi:hypothetical protein
MFVSFKILYESIKKSCRIIRNVYKRIPSTSLRKFKYVTSIYRWFSIAVEISTQISYGRLSPSYKHPRLGNEWSFVWFSGFHGYGVCVCMYMYIYIVCACVRAWATDWGALHSVVTIHLGLCVTSQAASMGSHWGVITSHTGPRLKCCIKYDHDNIRTVYTRSNRLAGP